MTHKESSSHEPRSADETLPRSKRAGDERAAAERPATLDDEVVIDDDEVLVEDDEDLLPD
jgi:hypothetical protein